MMRRFARSAVVRNLSMRPMTAINQLRNDEAANLWGSHSPPPATLPTRSLQYWLSVGSDPYLDATTSINVSHHIEDSLGTDLSASARNTPLGTESMAVWRTYFEDRYLRMLRQARRTGSSSIGTLRDSFVSRDEADNPQTAWAMDEEFKALLAATSGVLANETPTTLEQLEMAVLRATPEVFAQWCQKVPKQTLLTLLPVPSPASLHFVDEPLVEWAKRYQQERLLASDYIETKLIPQLRKSGSNEAEGWTAVCKAIGGKLNEIENIRQQRRVRQWTKLVADEALKAECGGDENKLWWALTDEQRAAFGLSQAKVFANSVIQGLIDGEDKADESEEWLKENESISVLAAAALSAEIPLTLADIWKHTIRLEELEFEHLLKSPHAATLRGNSLVAMYSEFSVSASHAALNRSLAQSQFDLSAGGKFGHVIPELNEAWLKWQWCKFGAGTMTQHVNQTSRQLHHHHARVTDQAPGGAGGHCYALAALHYKLRPLSSALQRATPYKYRQSLVAACVEYAIAERIAFNTMATKDLILHSKGEQIVSALFKRETAILGAARRALETADRTRLMVHEGKFETLALSVEDEAVVKARKERGKIEKDDDANAWFAGCSRTLSFQWNDLPREAASLEISLWKEITETERNNRKGLHEQELKTLQEFQTATGPLGKDIQSYIRSTGARILGKLPLDLAAAEKIVDDTIPMKGEAGDGYAFVGMLDDRYTVPKSQLLCGKGTVPLWLPFAFRPSLDSTGGESGMLAPLPEGTYRLRIRGFNSASNPEHKPIQCVESFTAPFQVRNRLPQRIAAFEKKGNLQSLPLVLPGHDLVGLCAFLRECGFVIPTQLEIDAGQTLTPKGEIVLVNFLELCASGKHHIDAGYWGSQVGITQAQHRAEKTVWEQWSLMNPGATIAEWGCARRAALNYAFQHERDWVLPDDNLEFQPGKFHAYDAHLRYGRDKLGAGKCSSTDAPHSPAPRVHATVEGSGALLSLNIIPPAAITGADYPSLESVLLDCTAAINNAQSRLNVLGAVATRQGRRDATRYLSSHRHLTDLGGKYAPTYVKCFERAQRELDGHVDEVDERYAGETDRFASVDDPYLRRRSFNIRRTLRGADSDNIPEEHKTLWGKPSP